MLRQKTITIFIPAKELELPQNTSPVSTLEDKIKKSIIHTRNISVESTMLFINKYQFDPDLMGYNVIARLTKFNH